MAVPPKGAKAVIEAILKTFAGIKYDSVRANIRASNKSMKIKQENLFDYQPITASL